jgi:hypothetical protein
VAPVKQVRFRRPPRRKKSASCCTVKIVSNPEGAIVYQEGSALGRTPFPLQVKPGEQIQIRLSREGWAEKKLTIVGRANETRTVELKR